MVTHCFYYLKLSKMAGKMKTHKWVAKRFSITKSGKMMHKKAWRNHLLSNKWRSNKVFTEWKILKTQEMDRINRLLPYGLK
jgi:large subunit ribosomal protein L35